MKKWFLKNKSADFQYMANKFHISEVVARLLVNRGITTDEEIEEYIQASVDKLGNPMLMKDMEKGINLIYEKIIKKQKIRIIGDYDVDGIISTYILIEALKKCGAVVDFEIPDRIKDGYGMNIEMINDAVRDEIDTILTCDNGISALEQIRYAKEKGLTVVITDHHDIPFEESEKGRIQNIPEADAVINPHREDCKYPFKNLCGAAVAFKFVEALYMKMGLHREDAKHFVEYIAIATICDVMDLRGENRTFVKTGLKMLANTKNPGLKILMQINGVQEPGAYHLGFVIGPCLNATGRLASAKRAIELLCCQDEKEAYVLANELKELNDSRKQMTQEGLEAAIEVIENTSIKEDKVIVVYLKNCHESLAGIIAGRLRDRYYRPIVVLTDSENMAKGSCRSIESYNMFEELLKCKDLIEKFGGHPMAAGLSLKEENIEPLRMALNQNTTLTDEELVAKTSIDILLPLGFVNENLVQELSLIEPCGKGNEKPVFAEKDVRINWAKVFGKNANVLKLNITNQYQKTMEAVFFGEIEYFNKYVEEKYGKEELNKMYKGMLNNVKLSLVYIPSINEYNGKKSLQIQIKEYQ